MMGIDDMLVAWGVTQAVGFAFKPVLEELAKDAVKDYTKDFFKSSLGKVIRLPEKEPLQKAAGKALKEFLELVQQELEDAEKEVKEYIKPLKKFVKDKTVAETLGSAFENHRQFIETQTLSKTWQDLNLLSLPDEFSWERVAKRYLKKAKAILREDEELRNILDSENLEIIAGAVEVQPEFDLRKHQEGIRERYANLNLESLDASGYAYNELKLWTVFIPQNVRECQEYLPRVLEIPKEHQRRLKESGDLEEQLSLEEMERYQKAYFQQSARSVLEVVKDASFKYFVILGDPGSGKSTLLQYLALEWARLSPKDLPQQPIPLLIELRAYNRNREAGQCKDFLEFFHQGSGIVCRLPQQELHQRLKMGNCLVMFDGLDEVFDRGQREEIITDIHRFTNDYPNLRVIVTSRVIGYKAQKLRDAEFRHFMLEDLERQQIDDFMENWHELTYDDEGEKIRKRERLKRSISQSSAIAQLAGNPLLLTMMAILNRHQELPRDRAELYNQASRLLLHQWDFERTLQDSKITIDYREKQEILRRVAFSMQSSEKGLAGNFIAWQDLVEVVAKYLRSIELTGPRELAKLLIEKLRGRNFILCDLGADSYAFIHRTFLEYFCAAEFVQRFEKRRQISPEELKTDIFGSHWRDESWHEVLQLIAGQIDVKYVGKIIEYLLAEDGEGEKFVNVFLAAKCLGEVRNRHQIGAVSRRLLERLKGLVKYDLRYSYEPFGDEAELVQKIRTQAVAAVAATWHDDPHTLPFLKRRVESDENWQVRRAAVEEIARGWHDDPDTLPILKGRVESDENEYVRRAAVEEIARGWHDDPDTLPILKRRVESDENWQVRRAAVEELARGWHDDPDTLPFLKDRVESDENEYVRGAAVEQLARGWHDDPDTLPILKRRVESDEDNNVRGAAVEQLARGWHGEPGIFELLHYRALNDPFERQEDRQTNPRETALEAIVKYYSDRPETLPLLRNKAENDPDEKVRGAAVQELARGWHDEPGIFELLHDRALNDPFERKKDWQDNPRETALNAIAKYYPHHPETLPLFNDRAEGDPDEQVREYAKKTLERWR